MSKSNGVRATTTTELGINLKPMLCIGKGPDCIQNVCALRINPGGTLFSINGITAGEKFRGCRRNVRKTSVNTVLYVSTSGSL